MTPGEFVTWVSLNAPGLRPELDVLAAEWGEPPPQTEVCLFVLVPTYVAAVQSGAAGRVDEVANLFERMTTHPDEDLPTHVVLTVAPALAERLSPDQLRASVGEHMLAELAPWLTNGV